MKRFQIFTIMICAAASAFASDATDAASLARSRAEGYFMQSRRAKGTVGATSQLQLKWCDAQERVFLFTSGASGEYVITSSSALTAPVLGYADGAAFDFTHMPPAMQWLLEEYAREIEWAEKHGSTTLTRRAPEQRVTPVSPLLGEIAWDQQYPYNLNCPTFYGNERSATGCVATAMAQVMYYHQYPERGRGENLWTQELYPLMGDLFTDFSQSVYEWSAMKPKYNYAGIEDSEASCKAVARLMADCGAAVNMQYGPSSGSMGELWPYGLNEYFDYDGGMALRWRDHYTQTEWDEALRRDLQAGLPVLVSGFTKNSGGHAFVFDGVDADGLYHVNWGWSGMSNGYFRGNVLTPASQGTGGAAGGFNYKLLAVTGIQPPVEGSEDAMEICSEEMLSTSRATYMRDEAIAFRLRGKIENLGWKKVSCDFAVGIYNLDGTLVKIIEGAKDVPMVPSVAQRGTTFPETLLSDLAAGSYEARPLVKAAGGKNWTRILDKSSAYTNRVRLTVDEESIRISELTYSNLTGTVQFPPHSIYTQRGCVTYTVTNEGESEYYGPLTIVLYDKETKVKLGNAGEAMVGIASGATVSGKIVYDITAQPGEYSVALVDHNANFIGGMQDITVESVATPCEITATQAPQVMDAEAVDPMNVNITAKVKCTAGIYTDQILLYFYSGKQEVGCLDPVFITLEKDEEAALSFSGVFENAVPGAEYAAVLVDGSNLTFVLPKEEARATFRIKGSNAVTGVVDENAETEYYTLQGVRVDAPTASGIYIVKRGSHREKTLVK